MRAHWAVILATMLWACGGSDEAPLAGASSGGSPAGAGGGKGASCETGTEACRCYRNGTCNAGLTCASDLCVVVGGQGGADGGSSPATGGRAGAGGVPATGGTMGTGGAGQCGPSGTVCSTTNACCLGLICVTEIGRTNGVCTPACRSDVDCVSGCCAPLESGLGTVCAPPQYCAGSCLPELSDCTAFPVACCPGTTCVYDDPSDVRASCQYICQFDSECPQGCCAPVSGASYSACGSPSYCGGSCLPVGTRPCGLGVPCCSGSYCTSDAINQICLPLCYTHGECATGCCASPNGNGITVCADPGYCGGSSGCWNPCPWTGDGVCDEPVGCCSGTDFADCTAGNACSDTCFYAFDGYCDDGGFGADYAVCSLGTDCADCGARF